MILRVYENLDRYHPSKYEDSSVHGILAYTLDDQPNTLEASGQYIK
jgi:hypothetical protein